MCDLARIVLTVLQQDATTKMGLTKKSSDYNHKEHIWEELVCAVNMMDYRQLGAVSIRKTVLPGMAIPMLKIRRPNGRLIFNMEITIRR